MRHTLNLANICTEKAADGAGNALLVIDCEHIVLALDTSDSANLVIHFQGSMSETEPTWADAQAVDNQWDYVQVKDLEDGSAVDGDTGITLSGTDDHRMFEVNTNGLRWLNAIVSSYSAGKLTVRATGFTTL